MSIWTTPWICSGAFQTGSISPSSLSLTSFQDTDRLHIFSGLNIKGQITILSNCFLCDTGRCQQKPTRTAVKASQWQIWKSCYSFFPFQPELYLSILPSILGGFKLDYPVWVRNTLNNFPPLKTQSFASCYNLSSQSFSKSWKSWKCMFIHILSLP